MPAAVFASCAASSSGAFAAYIGDGTNLRQGADASDVLSLGEGTSNLTASTWAQANYSYDGSTATYRQSSAANGSASASYSITTPINLLFVDHSTSTNFLSGPIAALLIYTENSTTPNKQIVETYLACKYGVT